MFSAREKKGERREKERDCIFFIRAQSQGGTDGTRGGAGVGKDLSDAERASIARVQRSYPRTGVRVYVARATTTHTATIATVFPPLLARVKALFHYV